MTTSAAEIQLDFITVPPASTPPIGVDLWLLDLSKFTDKSHSEFTTLVAADELARASHFKKNSSHFLATRALLRAVLAHYTGLGAQALLFALGEYGKPFLSNAPAPLHFNLSHCNDLAVLAVSVQGEVGVDIETASARDYLKIAERYFHCAELQALHACTITERERLFYKLWTLKEAFFKATGGGISSGLNKICFQFDNDTINVNFNSALNEQGSHWQFEQQLIAANTWVALVLHSTESIEHQWLNGNSLLTGA